MDIQAHSNLRGLLSSIGRPHTTGDAGSKPPSSTVTNGLQAKRKAQAMSNYLEKTHSNPASKKKTTTVVSVQKENYECVETATDPDNIGVSDYSVFEGKLCPYNKLVYKLNSEGQKEKYVRTIPHFSRLHDKTNVLLPRYVFRVVHAESAGSIKKVDGVTHFLSHASMLDEASGQANSVDSTTAFDTFSQEDIAEQLRCHISGWKSSHGQQFNSRWISVTDSYEAAISRAEQYRSRSRRDISIYVIDTNTLQVPTLTMLIFLAMKAYDVESKMTGWVFNLYRYNSLTEWVFWDKVVVSNATKILYEDFSRPANKPDTLCMPRLEDLIPLVIKGARIKKPRRGVPRSQVRKGIYHSDTEKKEIEHFETSIFARRCGPLPSIPRAAKDDVRSRIEDKIVERVWTMVTDSSVKHVLFIWMLSLMTKQYYADNIIESVVRLHPEAISAFLDEIPDSQNLDSTQTFVYCMSGPECLGRIDVNRFQQLTVSCIKERMRTQRSSPCNSQSVAEVYILAGADRPVRNLVRLEELGLQGCCKSIAEWSYHHAQKGLLSSREVRLRGTKIRMEETDEQRRDRLRADYGGMFYLPDHVNRSISTRVKHPEQLSTSREASNFVNENTKAPCESPKPTSFGAQDRLRLIQCSVPVPVGEKAVSIRLERPELSE